MLSLIHIFFSYLGGGSDEAVKHNRGNNEKKEPAMQEQR